MAISMGWKSDQCTKMDAHSGGRDPPLPPRIFNGGGDAHRVKGDAHPPLPYEHPSPPYVPVTPYEQLKFLVGIVQPLMEYTRTQKTCPLNIKNIAQQNNLSFPQDMGSLSIMPV